MVDAVPKMAANRGGGFQIDDTYDASVTAAQQAVIAFAVAEWDATLLTAGINPASYPISFRFGQTQNQNALAEANTTWFSSSGMLVSSEVVFNQNVQWYVDPNPASDDEFQSGFQNQFDLLTVARHEIGHALGWVGTGNPLVHNFVSGSTFDASGLNIALRVGDEAHSSDGEHPEDVMNFSLGSWTRRPVSAYPSVALISQAFSYTLSDVFFADPNRSGSGNGTVWFPFDSFWQGYVAAAAVPGGGTLVLYPGSFQESLPHHFTSKVQFMSVRGSGTELQD